MFPASAVPRKGDEDKVNTIIVIILNIFFISNLVTCPPSKKRAGGETEIGSVISSLQTPTETSYISTYLYKIA